MYYFNEQIFIWFAVEGPTVFIFIFTNTVPIEEEEKNSLYSHQKAKYK